MSLFRQPSLDPARLEGESMQAYRKRREYNKRRARRALHGFAYVYPRNRKSLFRAMRRKEIKAAGGFRQFKRGKRGVHA